MQGAIDMVNRIIQENLTAIRVVKSYVRGDHEIQKFEEVNYNLRFTAEKAFRLAVLNMPAMQLVMYSHHPVHPVVRRQAGHHRRREGG